MTGPTRRSQVYATLAALIALALATRPSDAVTITVPDDLPTIQQAIDALPDTVVVRPGVYGETARVTSAIVLLGSPTDPPALQGMSFLLPGGLVLVNGFRFLGRVWTEYSAPDSRIRFTSCEFGSVDDVGGAGYGTGQGVIQQITFTRCVFRGLANLTSREVTLDSCLVQGQLHSSGEYTIQLSLTSCTFSTLGGGAAVEALVSNVVATGNSFEGYHYGLLGYSNGLVCRSNRFQGCSWAAIQFTGFGMEVVDNRIERCGQAMWLEGSGRFDSNLVSRSLGGIQLYCHGATRAIGNQIGRCSRAGIDIQDEGRHVPHPPDGSPDIIVRGNTSFLNGGPGYVASAFDQTYELSHNIGYGNPIFAHFFYDTAAVLLTVDCNDWYANGIQGNLFPGDFAVDPMFCDTATDDVHLMRSSPLLSGACAPIGALGEGCDVPTLATTLEAERVPQGVRLRWVLADPGRFDAVWIERAEASEGPWRRIETESDGSGDVRVDLDRGAAAEHEYWYRLSGRAGSQEQVVTGPVVVRAGPERRFALAHVTPNPASGPVRIEFDLAEPAVISVDVFDIQGRHVASVTRGSFAAGTHVVHWSGDTNHGREPSGLYLVRYRYPSGEQVRGFVRAQ